MRVWPARSMTQLAALLAALPLVFADDASALQQQRADATVTVVAGEYAAGGLHRALFGSGYRRLWGTPVRVAVLDLRTEAGGLQPLMVVGRSQTRGLALRGADGRSYTFRSIDKDLVRMLPEELRDTAVADIAQDQITASLPGGSLVAAALARAAGVLEPQPRLVVMPDDDVLGPFRSEFAGVLGTLAEYPSVHAEGTGTFGATAIVDTFEMFAMHDAAAEGRVDDRAFLRARLVDMLLGDWDRHAGQWRFARLPGEAGWQPLPEDRDQAFSRYEGLAMAMARDREPKFDRFGPRFPGLVGLTWNARSLDRRLLSGLARDAYVGVARDLQRRLTDEAIAAAVAQLPSEYAAIEGERLAQGLRARRDGLVEQAERFYEFLAAEVNLHGTDAGDCVLLEAHADGSVTATIGPGQEGSCAAAATGLPVVERRLLPEETASLRIYSGSGSDRLLLRGDFDAAMKVHVVADGELTLQSNGADVRAFDAATLTGPGKGIEVAEGVWIAPRESLAAAAAPERSQGPMLRARRDWGSTRYRLPYFGVAPDFGVLLGLGLNIETYAFRKRPYAAQHEIRFGVAFGSLRPRLDYAGTFRSENRRVYWSVRALASGLETFNYFGPGNETPSDLERDAYRVRQSLGMVEFRVARTFGRSVNLSTGPVVQYSHTSDDQDRLIGQLRPYGTGDVGQLGWSFAFNVNTRRSPVNAELKGSDDIFRFGPPTLGRGYTFDATVRYWAPTWDLRHDYGRAETTATASYSIGPGTALGIRLGGVTTWGTVPYYDAAFIGGSEIRGLLNNRFAGDSSAWGNAALAQRLGRLTLVVPGRWGILAIGNVGRVWLDGEDSRTWHWSYGGGFWWAPWDLQNALRLVVASSDDGVRGYLLLGFGL